jgi:hypothetical protein
VKKIVFFLEERALDLLGGTQGWSGVKVICDEILEFVCLIAVVK